MSSWGIFSPSDCPKYHRNRAKATPPLAVKISTKNIRERIATMPTPNRTFFRRPSQAAVVALLFFAACVSLAALIVTSQVSKVFNGGQRTQGIKFPVEMKQFTWKVVDEAGSPVKGVRVTAAGLRSIESPSNGFGWPADNAIQKEYVTDGSGEIDLAYPVKFGMPGYWSTTSKLFVRLQHSDFVADQVEVDPTISGAAHVLVKGCPTAFRCINADGVALTKFAVVMAGKGGEALWKLDAEEVRSRGIPEGTWQSMLVAPSIDGQHQFSEIFNINGVKGKDVVREITVHPGMRLSGSLSDNVPRPIENGTVIAWCVPKPLGPSLVNNPSVTWLQGTPISADGTFEFPSLPAGQSVQLVALCNGWLIEGMEGSLMKGIELTLDGKQLSENRVSGICLQMEPAGLLEVEVIGHDGKPLAGAEVSSWQNHCMSHNGGCTLLGHYYDSIKFAEAQIADTIPPTADLNKPGRYIQSTDFRGIALLRDIPLRQHLKLFVSHESLTATPDIGASDGSFAGEIDYRCDSPSKKTMTVHMHPSKEASNPSVHKDAMRPEPEKALSDTQLGSTMNKQGFGFDVEQLTTDEFTKITEERTVSVNSRSKGAILDYADSLKTTPAEVSTSVQLLRDGTDTLSLKALTLILLDKNAQPISSLLIEHDDPVVRFVARLSMAMCGDTKSVQSMHALINDTSLSQIDRQIICNWSNGVGIRPTDSPADIVEHFANVTSKEPKFKKGDLAPDFEFETVAGSKVSSRDLRGKIIVLHFWATSCGPCMGQMASHIESLLKHDENSLEVVFVSLDDEQHKFLDAVKKYKIPFRNVRDERRWGGELARKFGVSSMPFDVVIDANGTIVSNSIDDLPRLLRVTANR